MVFSEKPRLVALEELVPLCPWRTQTPPFPGNQKVQYVKVKRPLIKDGARVFWAPRALIFGNEDEDIKGLRIPFEGLFEFVCESVINYVKKWVDRLLGQIFSLPKCDVSNKNV